MNDTSPIVIADVVDQQTSTNFYYPDANGITVQPFGHVGMTLETTGTIGMRVDCSGDRVNWQAVSVKYINNGISFPTAGFTQITSPIANYEIPSPVKYWRLVIRFITTPNSLRAVIRRV